MVKELTSKDVWRCLRVNGGRVAAVVSLLVLSVVLSSCAGPAGAGPAGKDFVAEAREAITGADPAMGDWQGGWRLNDESDSGPLVAQVIALGKGEYRANFFEAFDFDTRVEPIGILVGRMEGEVVRLAGRAYDSGIDFEVKAKIEGGKLAGAFEGSDVAGTFALERVFRVSETMGEKPPKGAIVLFNGDDFKEWKHARKPAGQDEVKWELVDGAMRVKPGTGDIITKKKFTDVLVHVEFRSPFMPSARGQGRGNSGVYLQGRYEVQVLDSYGLKGEDNECGGIYKVSRPRVNMCAPPGQWQTYDITFRAATGESRPSLTVRHNGVLIQEDVKVGGATTAALGGKATEPGGIYLQDHGNLVEYRHIWLVEQ